MPVDAMFNPSNAGKRMTTFKEEVYNVSALIPDTGIVHFHFEIDTSHLDLFFILIIPKNAL